LFNWENFYNDNDPVFEDEYLIDIYTIVSSTVDFGQRKRIPKYPHKQADWNDFKQMLLNTNQFKDRLRMLPHHFDYLLE
jgi:hypothetical protein